MSDAEKRYAEALQYAEELEAEVERLRAKIEEIRAYLDVLSARTIDARRVLDNL